MYTKFSFVVPKGDYTIDLYNYIIMTMFTIIVLILVY